jgi:hypothetical protein
MEYKEAKEIIGKFKEAVQRLEYDASFYYTEKDRSQKLESKNKILQEQVKELTKFRRLYTLLASASNVAICDQCDGAGGHIIDMGEQGCEGMECDACQGTGIIDKAVVNGG